MAGVRRVDHTSQALDPRHAPWLDTPEHLDAYPDEFVFCFNRRTSGLRGMLFYRLRQQAVVTPPVTYGEKGGKAKAAE